MVKRDAAEAELDAQPEAKRTRPTSRDHLSRLSDELILRILSYLPVSDLAVSQRYVSPFCSLSQNTNLTDCLTSTIPWPEMDSYGSRTIIIDSYAQGQVDCLD